MKMTLEIFVFNEAFFFKVRPFNLRAQCQHRNSMVLVLTVYVSKPDK